MLDYLIALLDDSNDFLWKAAKASHAVLLCPMEQGEVTSWSDTEKIDQIRWAKAQRHVVPTQPSNSSQKFRKNQSGQKVSKSMPCVYYNDNSCNFHKHHETKGVFYQHICSTCFAQHGKISVHSALDCKNKTSNNEYGKAGSCLPLVGSLQYRTLANYMYWFPLPFQLPIVI